MTVDDSTILLSCPHSPPPEHPLEHLGVENELQEIMLIPDNVLNEQISPRRTTQSPLLRHCYAITRNRRMRSSWGDICSSGFVTEYLISVTIHHFRGSFVTILSWSMTIHLYRATFVTRLGIFVTMHTHEAAFVTRMGIPMTITSTWNKNLTAWYKKKTSRITEQLKK